MKRKSCHHIETSQLICRTNQLAGVYMMATLVFNVSNMLIMLKFWNVFRQWGKIEYYTSSQKRKQEIVTKLPSSVIVTN